MKILEVTLFCNDLEKAENFYSGKLGLKIKDRQTSKISFSVGSTLLTFLKSTIEDPVYHFAFNIPHNQLIEIADWISERAQIISSPGKGMIVDFHNWNAKSVYFYDPLGNILEIIARFDLPEQSTSKVTGQSLLCISEIGISTENVLKLVQNITAKWDIEIYNKQPLLRNFAAMGDPNGLLIISLTGRKWYPTEIISAPFYTRIIVENHQKLNELVFNP